MDYEDEGTASLLADAWCDAKKDPFRGALLGVPVASQLTSSPSARGDPLGLCMMFGEDSDKHRFLSGFAWIASEKRSDPCGCGSKMGTQNGSP